MFAFVLLAIQPLVKNMLPENLVGWFALASFFCGVYALAALATAKCPTCRKPFIGNTIPDGGGPAPKPFTSVCQYCGYELR